MSDQPLASQAAPVAVLMTLYIKDRLDYFEDALSSVETQSCGRPIRVYLCCDGPLSPEQDHWLATHTERFYRVIRNPVNIGLAAALNNLIEALGDEPYVFRMDGDDISLPGRFAAQIAMMEHDPSLSIIGCQAEDIDDDGAVTNLRNYPTDPDTLRAMLGRVTPILHPTFCIRRAVFRNPAVRYPDAYLCEDLALLIIIAEQGGKLGNSSEKLFQWRTGSSFFRRRRDPKRGWVEMIWFLRGLRANGLLFTPEIVYPFMRLLLRVLPMGIIQFAYRTSLRGRLTGTERR